MKVLIDYLLQRYNAFLTEANSFIYFLRVKRANIVKNEENKRLEAIDPESLILFFRNHPLNSLSIIDAG